MAADNSLSAHPISPERKSAFRRKSLPSSLLTTGRFCRNGCRQDATRKLTCRLVIKEGCVAQGQAAPSLKERPVVLGVRVSDGLRKSIKVEAARRGVTVAALFEDMWKSYTERQRASR